MKAWLSIRYKFLFVTTLLLILCVGAYFALASQIFSRDKTELVFDLNRSVVANISSDIDTLFNGVTDKMKLVALLSQDSHPRSAQIINDIFNNDADIVFMASSRRFKEIDQVFFRDKIFTETYGLKERYFTADLLAKRPIPFHEIQTKGDAVWNASLKDGPPLIGFGKNVIPESGADRAKDGAPFALIAFVRADKLLKSFAGGRLNEVIAVSPKGEVLVHANAAFMHGARMMTAHPLFKQASASPVRTGVARYEIEGLEMLGAYSSGPTSKITVLSEVDGREAFSAIERLLKRSAIFGLIVLTLAFIAAILFSRTLSKPIQSLVEAMGRVSDGDLGTHIEIKSQDEIKVLADSFNSMIHDLRDSREKLEEINRDLEQKVKDRTKKLEEQNLAVKQAQEALLQTTRLAAVGEIAGRAAHEVLNPLTSILTRLEKVRSRLQQGPFQETRLLGEIVGSWEKDFGQGGFNRLVESWAAPSSVAPEQSLWQEDITNLRSIEKDLVEEVRHLLTDTDFLLKEGQRINKIVQGMRSFTVVKGDLKTIPARDLLHESVNIMADLAGHHGIEMVERYDVPDDQIRVDHDEFIQCVTNMLRNSIQAIRSQNRSERPAGQITCATSAEGGQIHIDISDTGVGIKPENVNKLFDSQFSTKPIDEGTGLGLSISRRFIRAYGGDICLLRSAPGQGCTFRISLPLNPMNQNQKTEPSTDEIKRIAV